MSDFHTEKLILRARRERRCRACPQPMLVGQPAMRWAGVYQGDFACDWFHPECAEAEQAFNHQAMIDKQRVHGDEWWTLEMLFEHHEIADMQWLIRDHPVVADRWDAEAIVARALLEDCDHG